jgi:polar amino acid transport system permease protein
MDAARSLGMPYATAMVQVVIPQAFRKVIPPLTNEFVSLVKDTSLLIIIGATVSQRELLGAARQLSATTFSATPFMTASIAYLVVTLPLIQVVRRLERRLLSGDEKLRFPSVQHIGGSPAR